jgi:hypothetical protein
MLAVAVVVEPQQAALLTVAVVLALPTQVQHFLEQQILAVAVAVAEIPLVLEMEQLAGLELLLFLIQLLLDLQLQLELIPKLPLAVITFLHLLALEQLLSNHGYTSNICWSS